VGAFSKPPPLDRGARQSSVLSYLPFARQVGDKEAGRGGRGEPPPRALALCRVPPPSPPRPTNRAEEGKARRSPTM
jgi:hypothetical protein